MNYQLTAIWALFLAALLGIHILLFGNAGHAQSRECWPEMQMVRTSVEDLQRVRVELEEQSQTLRGILAELKKRK